jgi:hypothetical protein
MKQISIIWSTEDVLEVRPDLSEEQADNVLDSAERHHDANEGINWIVLETIADIMYPRGEQEAEK